MKIGDAIKIIDNSINSGDLTITDDRGNEGDNTAICPICNNMTSVSTCYSWFILNDEDYNDVIEMLFCSKECWKKYLNKERKR